MLLPVLKFTFTVDYETIRIPKTKNKLFVSEIFTREKLHQTKLWENLYFCTHEDENKSLLLFESINFCAF